ncbi:MAG TPA: hypothetical protein PK777_05800 [Thermoguttaceae bacterium]|nr:hypothetical protein [Thermoguttaceae bacterium]
MRTVGMGLLAMGILVGLLGQTSIQAAPPGSVGVSVGAAVVGHPPGPPPGPARYWHRPPAHRPAWVVVPPPPPPPPPPPRRVYVYPPAVYYSYPPAYYSYEGSGGSFYYITPRAGITVTW